MNAFKIFLSHRYRSPEVNLFFFDLFSNMNIAELQFEVDAWNSEKRSVENKPTNVTRLERMVRGTHAFLGIYPFPGNLAVLPSREELLIQSSYFRLELDLAIRSRKPVLIYFDQRYRNILPCPADLRVCEFDAQEVLAGATAPSAAIFKKHFTNFCHEVEASLAFESARPRNRESKVGVLLPPSRDKRVCYDPDQIRLIESAVSGRGNDTVSFSWPPVLDRRFFLTLSELDWIITDIGDEPASAAIAAYVHGRFIPTMRLKRIPPDAETDEPSVLERTLFGGVEVGYRKDILRWRTGEELSSGFSARLVRLDEPLFRISKREQAGKYFRTAALRKEAVFLSYSGKDAEIGTSISAALRKRFEDVFDYKDGQSIRPGQPWLKEIFDKLSRAAVAVLLLSKSYADSDNCTHEAQEIVALHDSKRLKMIPINLDPASLDGQAKERLSYLRSTQYVSFAALNNNVEVLVQQITVIVDTA
jgi:TIR domain